MKIEIRKSAIKDLKHISEPYKYSIHIKKLTNFEPAYRLRVGNYRVLFDVFENTIIIGRVLHRQSSY